mgnify:CR=1 FL=1
MKPGDYEYSLDQIREFWELCGTEKIRDAKLMARALNGLVYSVSRPGNTTKEQDRAITNLLQAAVVNYEMRSELMGVYPEL